MKNISERPKDSEFKMPSLRVDGKVALVTGGSRGLGLGMALALAHSGADLALAARGEAQLKLAAELIKGCGGDALMVSIDLSQNGSIAELLQQVTEYYGGVDILINAASTNIRKPAEFVQVEEWDRVLDLNLKTVFFTCKESAGIMKSRGGGKIINVGSMTFERSIPNVALYAASKGGMRSLTHSLAVEWAPYNIQVNNIVPGRFWTAMTDQVFSNSELHKKTVEVIPQGRPGIASDLAGATVLLASEASDYMTGQSIVVDGGWMINSCVKG